jgi:D-alanyl-D-alanine carboxypeptidase/D-alanyl-D-alanine-endopeptidase (penicillin-binding protein 4)
VVDTLVLRGFGDPTLRMSDLVELCERLQDRGVRVVRSIIVDNSYFDDQDLPPAFDQQPNETAAFRAPISAAPVERNSYIINVLPGASPGQPARVRLAAAGYFALDAEIETVAEGGSRVIAVQRARDDGQMSLRLRGHVPANGLPSSFRRRVEDPIGYAGHALAEALERSGIRGPRTVQQGAAPDGLALLASRYSPTMAQLLHAVGKDSDNFVAETVLKVMAAEDRRPGTSAHGAELLQAMLADAGVPAGEATIVNGSGLFDGNLIAPSHLTAVLRHAYRNPAIRGEYLAHLAIGGQDGTLHRRLTNLPAPGIVRAKTGTLNDVISLSGYVLGPNDGQVIAFSVLINGARGRQHAARTLADDLVSAIARSLYPR